MRHRPGQDVALEAAVDGGRLEETDDDRKRAVAVRFLEDDDLVVLGLADHDADEFDCIYYL